MRDSLVLVVDPAPGTIRFSPLIPLLQLKSEVKRRGDLHPPPLLSQSDTDGVALAVTARLTQSHRHIVLCTSKSSVVWGVWGVVLLSYHPRHLVVVT